MKARIIHPPNRSEWGANIERKEKSISTATKMQRSETKTVVSSYRTFSRHTPVYDNGVSASKVACYRRSGISLTSHPGLWYSARYTYVRRRQDQQKRTAERHQNDESTTPLSRTGQSQNKQEGERWPDEREGTKVIRGFQSPIVRYCGVHCHLPDRQECQ